MYANIRYAINVCTVQCGTHTQKNCIKYFKC